ncbi:MAG: Gfo/Idh/MocA family oxidoreductase [Chloroflexi bacterium]|nr:Gfo/Idh/MocA family oxidoreductase [Chloroflexota bacterium]
MSVGVGVLGAGWIAAAHVDGIRRVGGTRVVAIAATSQARADSRAAEMDIPRAYVGWQDLLEDADVQVVHNATPTPLHAEINAAIISAGKHVVSDKPLTVTSAESAALLQQARQAGIVHAVTFNHRGFRSVHQMRAMIASGDIGTLHAIRGAYLQGWLIDPAAGNWRVQETRISGTLLDIGSHWFDLCEWATGERVASVLADLQQLQPSRGGAEGGSVLVRFASGARGSCMISQAATGRGNRLTLEAYGSRGALIWSSQTPDELLRLPAVGASAETLFGDPAAVPRSANLYSKAPPRHPEAWPDAWRNILAPVYATINGQPTAGDYPTFEAGLRNAQVLEAVQRSHNDERWTAVSG